MKTLTAIPLSELIKKAGSKRRVRASQGDYRADNYEGGAAYVG